MNEIPPHASTTSRTAHVHKQAGQPQRDLCHHSRSNDTSHDCSVHVIKERQFTYQRNSPRERPVRNSGHTGLCDPCGTCQSFLAIYRCRNTRPGWDGIPCGRKVRLHGAGVSETCNTFRCIPACSSMQAWDGGRGRGEAVTDTPRADLASRAGKCAPCTGWDLWRSGHPDRCGRSVPFRQRASCLPPAGSHAEDNLQYP